MSVHKLIVNEDTMSYTELMATIPDLIEHSDSIKVVEVARKYDQPSVRVPALYSDRLL